MWHKTGMIVHERDPYNAETPRERLLAPVTGEESFYVRNHGPVPELDAGSWSLSVEGLVDTPLRLTLGELQQNFEHHHVLATLQCAGNRRSGFLPVAGIPGEAPWGPGATSTARWTGARLGDVLHAAGLLPAAAHVEFAAPDVSELADPPQRYGGSVPVTKALADEVLLAWAMDGEPLPRVHGGPVRVVVPGWIGARSVKWIESVTVRAEPSENWFQATSYRLLPPEADPDSAGPGDGISLGPVALNCDILTPAPGARVVPGAVRVRGYAYAGEHRGVARVDVSGDGGATWLQADLEESDSPWAWRHWQVSLNLSTPGPHTLLARAWDTTGACQPESPRVLWNPKGYANNAWARVQVQVDAQD